MEEPDETRVWSREKEKNGEKDMAVKKWEKLKIPGKTNSIESLLQLNYWKIDAAVNAKGKTYTHPHCIAVQSL